MPCSSRIISEMLPEILTMEKRDFLNPIIQLFFLEIIEFPVTNEGVNIFSLNN